MKSLSLLLVTTIGLLTASVDTSTAQDLITVEFAKTADLDPLDPAAVWTGTGTTDVGEEVGIRAFGLQVSPGNGFTNVDAFTFQVTRGESLIASLDMTGTFTPTGDLSGTTGDIFLTGTQNSTLMSSTENALVTTMGSVSFVPIPEPTTQLLAFLIILGMIPVVRQRKLANARSLPHPTQN